MTPLLVAILLVAAAWAVARFHLRGPDLSAFDTPRLPPVREDPEPSREHHEAIALLRERVSSLDGVKRRDRLGAMRRLMDAGIVPVETDCRIDPVDADGVAAEWIVPPNHVRGRRFLYIHGGAFMLGSPKSHRGLTTRFAELTGCAVLSIDYRLMPEHPRLAGVEDCRTAYRFILANGPDGPGTPDVLFAAGDSAGGNLVLSLMAWVRDTGLRPVDACVALAPATDSTMGSPSLRANAATDVMLGAEFGRLLKLPRMLLLLSGWIQNKVNPSDPRVSPALGDLSNLPPTLVHASEAEMLEDDARRYVNRARAAGSPVELETWRHMLHVFQIFPELPETREAFERIGKFLDLNTPRPVAG